MKDFVSEFGLRGSAGLQLPRDTRTQRLQVPMQNMHWPKAFLLNSMLRDRSLLLWISWKNEHLSLGVCRKRARKRTMRVRRLHIMKTLHEKDFAMPLRTEEMRDER